MYRLNYPNDPGMHNSFRSRRKPPRQGSHQVGSVWNEMKANWLSLGIISVIICVIVGVQFWNEINAVQINRAVEESLRAVRKLQTNEVIFEKNNNKLVYIFGQLSTDEELSDPDYGVAVRAVKMRRRYEMYQWVEEKLADEVEDGDHSKPVIAYNYYKAWSDTLIDSDLFKNPVEFANPKDMPNSRTDVAQVVKVGNFILSKALLDKINDFKLITGHIRPQSSSDMRQIKLHAGLYYHTDDVWNPQIGDLRVEFAMAGGAGEDAETVTIIAKQDGHILSPYTTESGDEILILYFGWKTPEDVIRSDLAQKSWQIITIRIACCILLFVFVNGLTNVFDYMVFSPLEFRDVINLGSAFVTFCATLSIYTLVLAISWICYRPLIGLLFLVISACPAVIIFVRLYRRDNFESLQHRKA